MAHIVNKGGGGEPNPLDNQLLTSDGLKNKLAQLGAENLFYELEAVEVVDTYRIIDVENDEIKVLNGAKKTIEKHSPVLYVEDNFKPLSEKLRDTISSMNYVSVPEHPWIHIRK